MKKKKVCWNITTRCNQTCKYCHRFKGLEELSYEENKRILENLIRDGITDITWTGGEALLYPDLLKLLQIAKNNGVKNRLITNGEILAQNEESKEIYNYLDSLTLSIDSTHDETNFTLGRGEKHYSHIKQILDDTQKREINLKINTVVSKENIEQVEELGEFLNNYKINMWKLFKFMPLRETAQKNKSFFEITDKEFETIEKKNNIFKKFYNIEHLDYRKEKEMEEYVLIVANGDIYKTEKGKDILKGNALTDSVIKLFS